MTRIGVLGGTFNPIHLGHLRAAEEVAEALALDRVLLVPSAQPPHKAGGDALAPGAMRLAWVEAACAGNPRLSACDVEIARGGASYTVDTLRALAEEHAGRPVFIIGSDAFAELGTWREPKQLFALADFAVMARPGTPGRLADWIPEALRGEFALDPGGDARAPPRHGRRPARGRDLGARDLVVRHPGPGPDRAIDPLPGARGGAPRHRGERGSTLDSRSDR